MRNTSQDQELVNYITSPFSPSCQPAGEAKEYSGQNAILFISNQEKKIFLNHYM